MFIQIYKFDDEKLDPNNKANSIQHIKALREWLNEHYGSYGSLSFAIELINSVHKEQVRKRPIKVKRSDLETLKAMINDITVISETTPRQRHILLDMKERIEGMLQNEL